MLLTHDRDTIPKDRDTIPKFADERIEQGLPMSRVIVVSDRAPNRRILDDLMIIIECGEEADCRDRTLWLPWSN